MPLLSNFAKEMSSDQLGAAVHAKPHAFPAMFLSLQLCRSFMPSGRVAQ